MPKGYNLRFEINHKIYFENSQTPLFLCDAENPETLHPEYPPSDDMVDVKVIEKIMKDGKMIKTYNWKKQKIKGGKILTRVSYNLANQILLKFMETPSKMHLILLAVVVWLFGILKGGLAGMIISAMFFNGG